MSDLAHDVFLEWHRGEVVWALFSPILVCALGVVLLRFHAQRTQKCAALIETDGYYAEALERLEMVFDRYGWSGATPWIRSDVLDVFAQLVRERDAVCERLEERVECALAFAECALAAHTEGRPA